MKDTQPPPKKPGTIAEAVEAGIDIPPIRRFGPGTSEDLGEAIVIRTRRGRKKRSAIVRNKRIAIRRKS